MTSPITPSSLSVRIEDLSQQLSPSEETRLSECEALYGNGDGRISFSEYASFQKIGPELCRLENQTLSPLRKKFFGKNNGTTLVYEVSDFGEKAAITVRLQKEAQELAEAIFGPGETIPHNPLEFSLITSGLLDRVQEKDRSRWFLLIRTNHDTRHFLQRVVRDSHPQLVSRFFESLLTSRKGEGFVTESNAIWMANTLWTTLLGTQSEEELKRAASIISGIPNRSYQAFLMVLLHFRGKGSYDKIFFLLPSHNKEKIEKMIVTLRPHILSVAEYLQIETDRMKRPPDPSPLQPDLPCHNPLNQYEEGPDGSLFQEGKAGKLPQEDLLPLYQEALKKRGHLETFSLEKYETRSDPNPLRMVSMNFSPESDEWFAYFLPPLQEMTSALRQIEGEIQRLVAEGLTVDTIEEVGIPPQVRVVATHHQLGCVINSPEGLTVNYATLLQYDPETNRLMKEEKVPTVNAENAERR